MPSTASLPHTADPDDLRAEDAAYYRRVLHELIDIGMGLARAVPQQAEVEAEKPDAEAVRDAAVAFDRISRAVRRTVALARKVAEPVQQQPDTGQRRAVARRRILREVEDAIQREAEGADVEALEAELRERLDGPELDDEIDGRPTAEVVADICRDLGLLTLLGNHPWKRRGPRDIAALCARAARPLAGQPDAGQPDAGQPDAEPVAPGSPGCAATWAGPPSYSREASIELMHQLLALRPPIRGP